MITENKQTQTPSLTDVHAKILVDFKRAVMVVSLFANMTVLVSWAVISAS